MLDFDGLRAANAAFANDYARGGDVLIVAVARALERFAAPGEFPARLHTRGDEFCLLLPGSDDATTQARGRALEALLDDLDVPESHRQVYRGASVGAAVRERGRDAGRDRRPGLGRDARAQARRPRYSSVEMKTLLSSVLWASASMPSSLPTPDCL